MRRISAWLFTIFLIFVGVSVAPAHAACTSEQIDVLGDGTQCETTKFSLTTTELSANDTFQFSLSATGTFYVDCGADGVLSGTGVSGNTITRSVTTVTTYTCTYSTGGVKTIAFDGTATGYNSNTRASAISFGRVWNAGSSAYTDLTPAKIASISGDLSEMFPWLSGNSADGAAPRFYWTFRGATNLTTIPDDLFSNYTTGANYMFYETFSGCTGLTSIPADLFSGITTGAERMFSGTFFGCTGLTSIPAGLFSGVTTWAESMFSATFYGCTGLTSIPGNLFSGVTTGAIDMFQYTFKDCTGLTSIPADLFSGITTGAQYMFQYTFQGCTGLTSIPADLFSGITTGADYMFYGTFSRCTNLAGYIPPTTFKTGMGSYSNMWNYAFYNTQLLTSCPCGTKQYITGYEGSNSSTTWNGKVSCEPATDEYSVIYQMNGGTNYSGVPTSYFAGDGCTMIDGVPTKSGSTFAGWCTDSTLETCSMTQTIAADATGDKTFYAKWSECTACATTNASCSLSVVNNACTYTTTCDVGYINIQNNGEYNASCSPKPSCTSDEIDVLGDGTQCETAKFTVTTIDMPENTELYFKMSAIGTFYVDWGDGTVETITRATSTTMDTYSHIYTTGGTHTVRFGGLATAYSTNGERYAINFDGNTSVAGISGSLGAIFPTVGDGVASGTQPRFRYLFRNCINLTGTIPENLFSGVHGQPVSWQFGNIFNNCSGITGQIPANLFDGMAGKPAIGMYAHVFNGATTLTGNIPDGLFGDINGPGANFAYADTFYNCQNLHGEIPSGLFGTITSSAENMFRNTFMGCTGLTGWVPPELFAGLITAGSPYANNMMINVFTNSGLEESCPCGTKQYVTGYEGSWAGKVSCEPATDEYSVIYQMNGGTNYSGVPTSYFAGDGCTMIDGVPTKSGSTFAGWCTDSELQNCAMSQTIAADATGDKTFYAKWSECTACSATNATCSFDGVVNNVCTYTTACNTGYGDIQNNGAYNASCSGNTININWNGADGNLFEAGSCTYGGAITTPTTEPTKRGHIFTGWQFTQP